MSAYKKLNQQDAYITTYTARKSWIASGSQYRGLGINNIVGFSGSIPYYTSELDSIHGGNYPAENSSDFNRRLIYESTKHLYYSLFQDTDNVATGSYDNFLQSSYNVSGSRFLNERFAIFSLPKEMYGTHIEPLSVSITPDLMNGTDETGNLDNYVVNNYSTDEEQDPNGTSFDTEDNLYIENVEFLFGSTNVGCSLLNSDYIEDESEYVAETPAAGGEFLDIISTAQDCNEIVDDGEGRLYLKYSVPRYYVGDVIYTHGQLIITDIKIAEYFNNYFDAVLKWKSNLPIFTHNYHCKIKSNEFNYSQNKTSLKKLTDGTFNKDGVIETYLTGSDFPPYITSVGLYNDSNDLIAIGKMSSPTPKSLDTDMSIIVQLDMNFGSNRGFLGSGMSDNPDFPPVLVCTQYYVFRNFIFKSGERTARSGGRDGKRYYIDAGDYTLYRRRLPYTQSGIDIPRNSTAWTTEFKYVGNSSTGNDNTSLCYVDVKVEKYIRNNGEIYYEYDFGGYTPGTGATNPSSNNKIEAFAYASHPITGATYKPARRSHQFFKDILEAYLLLEDEDSLRDFGCEYPQPSSISGEA